MIRATISLLAATLFGSILGAQPPAGDSPVPTIKVGIIGLDTSHVTAFTKILNNPKSEGPLRGFKVVAAFPAGSPDVAVSRDRIAGFTKQLHETYGVEIVASIAELLPRVDAVLLESVDGRPHLEQVRPVILAKKRVFVDKPMAASLVDVIKIFDLAKEHKVPCFTASAYRFSPEITAMYKKGAVGNVLGADVFSQCTMEEHHPDLMWYGVHGVEMLYTLMGTGCEHVVRTSTPGTDVVTGVWKGGKVGNFRGLRQGRVDFGATVFGSKAIAKIGGASVYEPLLTEICKFFRTGQAPVSAEETIETFAFMEAADESKRLGGVPVPLDKVLAKARAAAGPTKQR